MTRTAAGALALVLCATGAAPATSTPEPLPLCAPPPAAGPDGFGGVVTVVIAGAAPRCGLTLREHHRHQAALAGADGTVYVAEESVKWNADDTDAGAVDVYARGGILPQRITDGIAGPSALALDARGRLLVLNTGHVLNRGIEVTTAPNVAAYERGATSPSAVYVLPPRAFARVLVVAPNGDIFVDVAQDAVSRLSPGNATPLRTFVTPHEPTVVGATSYPLDVRRLRVRGTESLVALFGGGNEPPFFAEWSLADGRLQRRVPVPKAIDLVIDGNDRIVVATFDGSALVFPPGATAPSDRWSTADEVTQSAADASGNVWFQGHDALVGLDRTGRRIAGYTLAKMGGVALIDAPR